MGEYLSQIHSNVGMSIGESVSQSGGAMIACCEDEVNNRKGC